MKSRLGEFCVIAVLACAAHSHAETTLLSASRLVDVEGVVLGGGSYHSESANSVNFEHFVQTVSFIDFEHFGTCTASQDSEFVQNLGQPTRIHAAGSASPSDGHQTWGSSARSLFDASFTVDEPTPYHLVGNWTCDWQGPNSLPGPTSMFVRLPGVFATGTDSVMPPVGGQPYLVSFEQWGVLSPGSHRLWIDFDWEFLVVGTDYGARHSAYDVTLELPSPSSGLILASMALFAVRRRRS